MFEQIRRNQRNSAILIVVVAALLLGLGYALGETLHPGGGLPGLGIAFAVWVVLTLTAFAGGRGIFLALGGARKIQKTDHPVLWNVVEEMTIAAGLGRMPDVYIIEDPAPNAFATGKSPKEAAVAVTTGLLSVCNRDELQGVVAHEIGHVKNRDVLYMILVGVMVGAIVILADIGLRVVFYSGAGRSRRSRSSDSGQAQLVFLAVAIALAILAPILAQLLYFACSRRREYLADASGAQFTRYPEGLASALEKIASSSTRMQRPNRVLAPMYIHTPVRAALSSTHPPIEERIRILRAMGSGASFVDYDAAYRKIRHRKGIVPAGALAGGTAAAAREPSAAAKPESARDRVRQTTDMLWKLNRYAFIPCACGTQLKIPPSLKLAEVTCPHCGRKNPVPRPASP